MMERREKIITAIIVVLLCIALLIVLRAIQVGYVHFVP